LTRAAQSAGLEAAPLAALGSFLMRLGEADQFEGLFAGTHFQQERVKITLQLKHLMSPAGMGDRFQVMMAAKNAPINR
jgi:SAM-dependent MidA family methyltransferase